MDNDSDKKTEAKAHAQAEKRELIENVDFTWAGWPEQYPVPLFTWEELNQILEENNGKVTENMWKERMKRQK